MQKLIHIFLRNLLNSPATYMLNLYSLIVESSSPDGAYEYADADRKTFYTRAGRPVKDAGGTYIFLLMPY
jgi:hypothetical protein